MLDSGTYLSSEGVSCDSADPVLRLARRLRATILRPRGDVLLRPSLGPIAIPDELLLLPDGSVIATYEGEPLLRYPSLERMLEHHHLSRNDLEEPSA